jgi:hypothetical protein
LTIRHRNPWLRIAASAWSLSIDATAVVAVRTTKVAAGGAAAESEVRQMIGEKLEAASALQMMALTGALGWSAPAAATKTIAHYRRKVRANRRRLSKT